MTSMKYMFHICENIPESPEETYLKVSTGDTKSIHINESSGRKCYLIAENNSAHRGLPQYLLLLRRLKIIKPSMEVAVVTKNLYVHSVI